MWAVIVREDAADTDRFWQMGNRREDFRRSRKPEKPGPWRMVGGYWRLFAAQVRAIPE